jgi:hypothetical protein
MKTFKVVLRVETEHTYELEANTLEEAESIAEDIYQEGDDGEVASEVIDVIESYPTEE